MHDASTPLNRIVVGVDFDSASAAAAVWTACWLVRDAELVLVHAVPAADALATGSRNTTVRPHADSLAQRRVVERQLRELGHGVSADFVWYEVRDGNAADAMLATVTEFRADLVITGAPDESARPGDGGASTITRLLRRSTVPVVIAGGGLDRRPRRIVALADRDTPSIGVMQCARALAAPHDAEVTAAPRGARLAESPAARSRRGMPNGWERSAPVRYPGHARVDVGERWRGTTPAMWPDWLSDLPGAADPAEHVTPDLVVMSNAAIADGTLPWRDYRVTDLVGPTRCPVVVVPGPWMGSRG